jgi:hypothetical protein
MLIATLFAVITSTLLILSTPYGVGLPISTVPPENMIPILKVLLSPSLLKPPQLVMASTIFYFACNWSIKHPLLLFYQNLTIDPFPRLAIYILHAISVAFGPTCTLTNIFQC